MNDGMDQVEQLLAAAMEEEMAAGVKAAAQTFAAAVQPNLPKTIKAEVIEVERPEGPRCVVWVRSPWEKWEFGHIHHLWGKRTKYEPPRPVVRRTLAGMKPKLERIIAGE